jgi:hypothetical protein
MTNKVRWPVSETVVRIKEVTHWMITVEHPEGTPQPEIQAMAEDLAINYPVEGNTMGVESVTEFVEVTLAPKGN